jgi:hypothetical protein
MISHNRTKYSQLTDGSIIFTKFLSNLQPLKLAIDTKSHKLWRSLFFFKESSKINEKRIVSFNKKFLIKNEQIRVNIELY